jgi:hypothetical protein
MILPYLVSLIAGYGAGLTAISGANCCELMNFRLPSTTRAAISLIKTDAYPSLPIVKYRLIFPYLLLYGIRFARAHSKLTVRRDGRKLKFRLLPLHWNYDSPFNDSLRRISDKGRCAASHIIRMKEPNSKVWRERE